VRDVAELPDPVGASSTSARCRTVCGCRRSPCRSASIGSIYEARPNVTVDIAAWRCVRATPSCCAAGRRRSSNAALVAVMRDALGSVGIDPEAVQTVDDFGREGADALMQARGLVDVLVPRERAAHRDRRHAVSRAGDRNRRRRRAHRPRLSAPLEWAQQIVVNAKAQRPSVCNAVETVLVLRMPPTASSRRSPPRSKAPVSRSTATTVRGLVPAPCR
jgi:glutamate-5-semialdehyde dehydrogenase